MTQPVKFACSVGEATGVLAMPVAHTPGMAGVVVIQEYWGLNPQILATAQRWAAAGFAAIVPDLYHGKLAATAEEAKALMGALDFPQAVQEIAGAVAYLHTLGCHAVAVSGYCLGGALSFAAAVNVRGLACVVPYYGLPGDLDWTRVDAPIQAHFAAGDAWATVSGARKIQAVVPSMELHVYQAAHAFCNDSRPEVYDPQAARLAWDRTLAFVRGHTVIRA